MSRPWLLACLLVLSSVVAGCSSGKTLEATVDPSASSGPPGSEPLPGTSPPPTELSDDELLEYGVAPDPTTEEATCVPPESVVKDRGKPLDLNKSFEGGAHVHDYWLGRPEVTIWDDDIRVANNAAGVSMPFATAVQWVRPADVYVFPGASKAVFTVTWQEAVPGIPEARRLSWDMPGDQYGSGDLLSHVFLKSGDTYELALNLSNADPPHLNRTLWVFQLQDPETGYWTNGHVTWTIYRDSECLPVDPPHYDLWQGKELVILLDDERAGAWRQAVAKSGGLQLPDLLPNVTMFGASMVRVTLSWTDAPTNTKLGVRYCTALSACLTVGATWTTPSTYTETGPATRVYEIPVEKAQWDSPYVSRTDWLFQPYMDNGALAPALSDNGNFEGSAHWFIEVLRT